MSLILKVQDLPTKLSSEKKKYFVHYPPITFNKVPVKRVQSHKHLGLTLDLKLDFHEHISSILPKVNKLTAVSRKHFTKAFYLSNLQSLYKTSNELQ